jgi:hypothetical protein
LVTPAAPRASALPRRLLALLVLVFAVLAGSAMLRTSTTFDETVFMTVGARALETGDYSLVNDHPRLPQYLYGIPAWLTVTNYPSEARMHRWTWSSRYDYARAMLWNTGNDAKRIVMAARAVGLFFGVLTVLATFLLARRHLGEGAALFAAALVAFMPDVLAHSGVAYNDIPLALAFLAGVYALDAAVRRPTPGRVALAAFACALATCVKYSGVLLLPVLAVLIALEARAGRGRDRAWRTALLRGLPVFLAVTWATIAAIYLGDWRLDEFTAGLAELSRASAAGRPAFLLGEQNNGGWWYFFPVAFLLKTPIGLHVMMLIALGMAVLAAARGNVRAWLTHEARAPAAGAAIFLLAAMVTGFNIGTRHALPMIPLLCILVAQGVALSWERGGRAVRAALGVALAAFVLSSASAYPFFLSYLSEYVAGRPSSTVLVDSSTDWGQGLVALRDYMRERGIARVELAYFGSALPEGYGIAYDALPSFLELPKGGPHGTKPRYVVVSATLLAGLYVDHDPYASLRGAQPIAVLGGSLYVFDRQALGKL